MLPRVRNPVMMPLLIYFGMLDHKAFLKKDVKEQHSYV
jgi:hypothetical protein